ncbi:MAG: hypothetical protein SVR94_18840 [Pseudomonadota bacterium]|nr:hypothetical protein [Pseudomonadota bacterium]
MLNYFRQLATELNALINAQEKNLKTLSFGILTSLKLSCQALI